MAKLNGLLDSNQAEELKRLFGIEDQSSEEETSESEIDYSNIDVEDEAYKEAEEDTYEDPYENLRNNHVVDRLYKIEGDIEEEPPHRISF